MEVENFIKSVNNVSWPDFFSTFFSLFEYPSAVLLIAVLLEMVLPLGQSYKLSALKPLYAALSRKVNRKGYSQAQVALSGVCLPALILLVAFALVELCRFIIIYDALLSLIFLPFLLESKLAIKSIRSSSDALDAGDKNSSRRELQKLMIRDCSKLSAMGIYKAMSEHIAMSMFVNWFALLVWYLIMGVEGAVLLHTVSVMNRAFCTKEQNNRIFGAFVMRLEHFLLFPALIVFVLFMALSFFYARIIKNFIWHAKNYHDVISSVILDCMGSYTNTSLGGPRYYNGEIVRFNRLGGRNEPERKTPFKIYNKIRFTGVLFICTCVILKILQIMP